MITVSMKVIMGMTPTMITLSSEPSPPSSNWPLPWYHHVMTMMTMMITMMITMITVSMKVIMGMTPTMITLSSEPSPPSSTWPLPWYHHVIIATTMMITMILWRWSWRRPPLDHNITMWSLMTIIIMTIMTINTMIREALPCLCPSFFFKLFRKSFGPLPPNYTFKKSFYASLWQFYANRTLQIWIILNMGLPPTPPLNNVKKLQGGRREGGLPSWQ